MGLTSLKTLDLCLNDLSGEVPRSMGSSLKNLESFDVSQNKLSGSFPSGICSGKRLISLSLHSNFFEGSLSNSIGECLSLERFQVQNNGFSGQVPDSVSLASALEQVEIDNNSFSGEISHGLGLIKSLYKFSASENGFDGELPLNFFDSPVLSIVNISHNRLLGKIPELKNCKKLVYLSLASNAFTGEIPPSLADLHVLTYLDLSDNRLTDMIPQDLQNLKLALYNVSFNRLSGEVPHSLISGLPASFLQGNPELCGPGLSNTCSSDQSSSHKTRGGSEVYVLSLATEELIAVKKLMNPKNISSKALKAQPGDKLQWSIRLKIALDLEPKLKLVTGQRAEKAEEGTSVESIDLVKQVRRKINLTNGAAQVLDQKILSP